mgnify:CR=1 FL=1
MRFAGELLLCGADAAHHDEADRRSQCDGAGQSVSPERSVVDHSGATLGAASVTGAPLVSQSTAGRSPCQRTAYDSVEAGPATRPC